MVDFVALSGRRSATARWRLRASKFRDSLLGLATIFAFIIVWAIVYAANVFPHWAFPSPWGVARGFVVTIADGTLLTNTWDSIVRQFVGVLLAAAFGIPAGLLLGASARSRAAFLPLCRVIYPIPGLA